MIRRSTIHSVLSMGDVVGWWDATDLASIAESSGLVSQWNDLSGNGYHATATGGLRPTYSATALGGYPGITFAGSHVLAIGSNVIGTNVSGVTMIAVFQTTSRTTLQRFFTVFTEAGGNRLILGIAETAGTITGTGDYSAAGRRITTDTYATLKAGTAVNNTRAIFTGRFDYANSDSYVNVNGDDLAANANFGTSGTGSASNSTAAFIGGGSAVPGNPFSGVISEIIVINKVLPLDDEKRIRWQLSLKHRINLVI